jgi:hypothetical protein
LTAAAAGAPTGSVLLCKQPLHIFEEFAQIFFYDAPHNPVINAVVAVCEDIPERHDIAMLPYLVTCRGVVPANSVQRFPDNLELPLNATPEQFIPLIIIKRLVTDEPENSRSSLFDVLEILEEIILHRGSSSL